MTGQKERTELLDFWFGALDERGVCAEDRGGFWFQVNPTTDRTIEQRFGAMVEKAGRGELDHWAETPRGRLALIILLDQFPRNIYRGSAQAFDHDPKARDLCLAGIERGHDRKLGPSERSFYYLPMEHSESVADQERSVALFKNFHAALDPAIADQFQNAVDYAVRHQVIIARFGRFPHRNAVLNRTSTREEQAYLAESGETFGQA